MRPYAIINPIITKVTFPIMAKVQNDIGRLKNIFLKTVNYLASINFPVYILIILLAEPIVLFLFGEKWTDSIVILQILSVYRMFSAVGNPIGSLQLARGRADLGFYWNLGIFFFVPPTLYIGSYWGLNGMAYALSGLMISLILPNWYFMVKPLSEAGFVEYFKQIFQPLSFAIIGGIFAYGVSLLCDIQYMYLNVALITVLMGIVVLILNVWFNRDFVDTFFELFRKHKKV